MSGINQNQIDESYLLKAAELLAPLKKLSYEPAVNRGAKKVLDVGCGPGIDTCVLANILGQDATVYGVDQDVNMVSAAKQRTVVSGVSDRVTHDECGAEHLKHEDNYFDYVRSERLFIHLQEPEKALDEMIRVTEPGGDIVVVDTDWGSLSSCTGDDKMERLLNRHLALDVASSGFSGRNLYGMFQHAMLDNISIEMQAVFVTELPLWRLISQMTQVEQSALKLGLISQDELEAWHATLEDQASKNLFFSSVSMVVARGQKPV